MKRRTSSVLTLIIFALAMALFCSCQDGGVPAENTPTYTQVRLPPASPQPLARPEETHSMLDLREANVLDVVSTLLPDGMVRFDVTMVHDDAGEAPSFADRWVVEDLEGNLLGERILLHAHGSEPFTRSATIPIPETISVVVVRGHDALHGFGGQAIRLDLRDGSQEPIKDTERE